MTTADEIVDEIVMVPVPKSRLMEVYRLLGLERDAVPFERVTAQGKKAFRIDAETSRA